MPNEVLIDGQRFVPATTEGLLDITTVLVAEYKRVAVPPHYVVGQKVKVVGVLGHRPKHPLGIGKIIQLVKDEVFVMGFVFVKFPKRSGVRVYACSTSFEIEPHHNLKVVS